MLVKENDYADFVIQEKINFYLEKKIHDSYFIQILKYISNYIFRQLVGNVRFWAQHL